LAPLLAQLIYFAVSRRREYLADASSAVFTRYPDGLASALEKLSTAGIPVERASKATAAMYIVNPFAKASLNEWTSTHPPAGARIKVLRSIGSTATFASYQQAWKNELGKKRGPLPPSVMTDTAHGGAVRAATALAGAARKDPREQARQVGDLLRGLNQFIFLPCACGLKLKLPPDYRRDTIECPRCHRELRVPVAELAAAQVAGARISGDLDGAVNVGEATVRNAPPPIPDNVQVVRRKPGEWMTFQCGCGRMQTISPAMIATRVKCPNCGRETQLVEQ
jgi:heat shock protein HtpX